MKLRPVTSGYGTPYGVTFECPGCGTTHTVPTHGPNAWIFNGDMERPTLTPSILVHPHGALDEQGQRYETPRCHSFVTDGRIQFLADSTHALAGQTVELPEIEVTCTEIP